jgi:hypothetical protein
MHVFNSLFPIFALVVIGAAMRRRGFLPESFFTNASRLVYRLGLPALLFGEIAGSQFRLGESGWIFLATFLAILAGLVVAFPIAALVGVGRGSVGTFAQCSIRCNVAYVGLPVIAYVFEGGGAGHAIAVTTLAIAPTIPLVNIISVLVLQVDRRHREPGADGENTFWEQMRKVFTNPLTIACAVGILWSLGGFGLPSSLARTCGALGSLSLPLALFSIGGSLDLARIRGSWRQPLAASMINVGLLPLLVFLIGHAIGLSPDEMLIALIMMACPAAATSYVMACELGGDGELAGSVVVFSTLLSAASLTIVVSLS